MTDLLTTYRAGGPGHDEMLQSSGPARAAWDQMADLAGIESWDSLRAATADVETLLQDHGVTYGAVGHDVPWRLDPLPVMIDEQEWIELESRLQQRAELLDEVLTDLTGERTLLASGVLPAEIVLGHPAFLRAADGIRIPGPHQLFLHAADIARNADGSWLALSDRTQTPSGMGYVMEDRRVVSQVLSGLYRQARIRRVGPFFHAMRLGLHEVAPSGSGEDPRIVLLTPGPQAETSFDQGYLSTMLGFPLVEGEDLVVADGRVWMRSLSDELEPVDVIVRRVDSELCDPLDLRGDSTQGVPGLLETARAGAVSIVNTLGSGLLENPALMTYLPRICRELRAEELRLPSTVTYWCGERSMCSHVIANLDRLVLTSTLPGSTPINGWEHTALERADLAAMIATNPHQWVGQEPAAASTTPTVGDRTLQASPTVLRTFAVARAEGYQVMSGALARIATDHDSTERLAREATSTAKDVWILSAEPQAAGEPLADEGPALITPRGRWARAITPGTAEDLYWFGRYSERTESTVRLLRAVADRWQDYHHTPGSAGGRALAILQEAMTAVIGEGSLAALVLDESIRGSVAFDVARSVRAASSVRDQLSGDTWLALSGVERALARARLRRSPDTDDGFGLGPVLARCLEGLLALAGIGAESMVRDVGWWLMDAGRRIERAQRLVQVLDSTVTERRTAVVELMVLESVLIANESVITYRRRSQTHTRLEVLIDLLLLDDANPRSLAYQLQALRTDLESLPSGGGRVSARNQLLTDLQDLVREVDPVTVVATDEHGGRPRLASLLESLRWRLSELSAEIARLHFTHPTASQWADAAGTWAPPVTPRAAGGASGGANR